MSLIGDQVLPIVVPAATTQTITVLAPALSGTPTGELITLTSTISGAPTGGTVTFTLPGGVTVTAPVINGVAQVIDFPIPAGTTAGTVTATYSGTTGFAGSTSSGAGNGTLAFCTDNGSTLLGTTLQTFAVLAGSTVTNTGATVIVGNVGVSPGSAVTGFPPGSVTAPSTIQGNNAVTILAQVQLTAAYTTILNEVGGFTNLTGVDLGGLILTPGRYHFDNSAQLTGTLILDNQNVPDARFDFQIGTTLTTASASRVLFINGGADNVYWQVGSSATLGSSTVFAGNILANTSITLVTAASIACGRALARSGAVTLDTNFIDPVPHEHVEDNGPTALATLQSEHGFHYVGSYYENTHGANEKWFQDRDNQWWALTPDGDLVQWDGISFASSTQKAVHLGSNVFDDPNLLLHATVATPASLLDQLSQSRSDHGFHFAGSYHRNAHGANEKWFQDRDNQWWALTSDGDLVQWNGISFASSSQNTVHLSPIVFDDPNRLFNATLAMPASLQNQLSQSRLDHGFHFVGSYNQNAHGANEKWFQDRDNQWWALTSDGDLVKWNGISFASSKQNAGTTVRLSAIVFDDPNLLFMESCGCGGNR